MLDREFLTSTWRSLEGNVALLLATGKTKPTEGAPHGKLIVNAPNWFHYPDELDKMVEFAQKNSDRDLYLTPAIYGDWPYLDTKNNKQIKEDRNGRPLYSRAKGNALMCAAIYMDSDSCPPEAFRIPPSRHVDTSDGHGHDWWYLSEPIPAHQAAEIAHRITTAHKADGSDPSGWAENKVLRMPTVNTGYDDTATYGTRPSHGDATFEVTFWETDAVYSADDISAAYEDVDVAPDVVQGESVPAPQMAELPDFMDLTSRIPASERRLNELIIKVPQTGEKGWRSTQRWALINDALRYGFTPIEAASLAWHAPAGAKWRDDDRGFDGLWLEVQKAVGSVAMERGAGIEAAAPVKRERPTGPKLVRENERRAFEKRSDMVSLYCEYARAKLPIFNGPLHNFNAWMLLSLGLGGAGAISKSDDLMPLNLYGMQLADNATGKSESKNFWRKTIVELYPGDNIEMPSDQSKSNLVEALINRDQKVTVIHADEFDGDLKILKTQGWSNGLQQTWTNVYDGWIPAIGRVGKSDLMKAGVRGIVNMHAMGTLDGILAELDKKMFYTGYLTRNIFVLGERIEVTEDSMKIRKGKKTTDATRRALPRWIASRMLRSRTAIRQDAPIGQMRSEVDITDEAADRFAKAKWEIWQHFRTFEDHKQWDGSIRRMFDIIWKIAALEALSFERSFIQESDIVVALANAEVWMDNLIFVAEAISETFFSKQCDEIESFIAGRKNHEATAAEVYTFRKGEEVRVTDTYLNSLIKQGRINEDSAGVGYPNVYKIKRRS